MTAGFGGMFRRDVLTFGRRAFVVADRGRAAFARKAIERLGARLAICRERGQRFAITLADIAEQHAVLRPRGSGERRLDVGEVQFQH
jgi:hypothetical protein